MEGFPPFFNPRIGLPPCYLFLAHVRYFEYCCIQETAMMQAAEATFKKWGAK